MFVNKGDVLDYSGMTLRLTPIRPQYFAGIYLLAAPGGEFIPPKAESNYIYSLIDQFITYNGAFQSIT